MGSVANAPPASSRAIKVFLIKPNERHIPRSLKIKGKTTQKQVTHPSLAAPGRVHVKLQHGVHLGLDSGRLPEHVPGGAAEHPGPADHGELPDFLGGVVAAGHHERAAVVGPLREHTTVMATTNTGLSSEPSMYVPCARPTAREDEEETRLGPSVSTSSIATVSPK